MKRLFSILAVVAMAFAMNNAAAQSNDFNKHWFMQLQGGTAHTIG